MTIATAIVGELRDQSYERWPGIVSRFQLVLLAGRRSKQLYNGAHPRIPVDPLKRRNTSIALEELRQGLVPFKVPKFNASQTIPSPSILPEREPGLILVSGNAEYVNERS